MVAEDEVVAEDEGRGVTCSRWGISRSRRPPRMRSTSGAVAASLAPPASGADSIPALAGPPAASGRGPARLGSAVKNR